jgi:hypothetical protein
VKTYAEHKRQREVVGFVSMQIGNGDEEEKAKRE